MTHHEIHRSHRIGWLRAAVLGVAGLIAGAMSMAAGEYVSVSSQADTEKADLELERESLAKNEAYEKRELAEIYEGRGLKPDLANEVAEQMMEHDALEAHARDEIGISMTVKARPVQAALSSAASFTVGAALPLSIAWLAPHSQLITLVAVSSLVFLALLGAIAARAGGAPMLKPAARVTFWGALAMALTAGVGRLFGVVA
jgi:VIT1/CCC1 family predicted Fe2+/Mn2+ transporter